MKIQCFPTKMKVSEAKTIAEKRGGFIGRIFIRDRKKINMKKLYIENKIITYDISFAPFPFMKKVFGKKDRKKSRIKIIANGSTGGVSYYDERGIDIITSEIEDQSLQMSDFDDDKLITKGNILARRILRRRIGGNMRMEVADIESVFRPYYIAFFGELIEGTKLRYLPIPADGCNVKRTF